MRLRYSILSAARTDIALPRLVAATRETPRLVAATLPAIERAARELADDLRRFGLGVQSERATAIANATRGVYERLENRALAVDGRGPWDVDEY